MKKKEGSFDYRLKLYIPEWKWKQWDKQLKEKNPNSLFFYNISSPD